MSDVMIVPEAAVRECLSGAEEVWIVSGGRLSFGSCLRKAARTVAARWVIMPGPIGGEVLLAHGDEVELRCHLDALLEASGCHLAGAPQPSERLLWRLASLCRVA